jgi:hypothetical protein
MIKINNHETITHLLTLKVALPQELKDRIREKYTRDLVVKDQKP